MSRHRQDDDDRDEPDHGTRGVPSSILVFGGLVLLLFAVAIVGGGWFLFASRQSARDEQTMRLEAEKARLEAIVAQQAVKPAGGITPLPRTTVAFEAAVRGLTRQQLEEKYGPPSRFQEDPTGNFDGPHSVYDGPFEGPKNWQAKTAKVLFRRSAIGASVASSVMFD